MMKIKLVSLFTIVLITAISYGQQSGSNISFEKTHHNYGNLNEEKGPADYKFIFTNTGNQPLLIKNVKPSCGCTTSDYSKQPIPPGAQGFVIARFAPKNRPGKFNKSITVTTNGSNPTTLLRISGVVIPKPKTTEDNYPIEMSKIRLSNHIVLGKVLNTEIKTVEIDFINNSTELVKVEFEKVPENINIISKPSILKPQQTGKIIVVYDGTKVNHYGQILHKIIVKENGQISNKSRIRINGFLSEDFSHLTAEELANAPVASFDKRTYNFGTIKQGEITKTVFTITNTGLSDLIIRQTKGSCGCTVVNPDKNIIKPGESTGIQASFNSRGRKGKQSKNIDVTTNDPNNPVIKLKITGTIVVPQD